MVCSATRVNPRTARRVAGTETQTVGRQGAGLDAARLGAVEGRADNAGRQQAGGKTGGAVGEGRAAETRVYRARTRRVQSTRPVGRRHGDQIDLAARLTRPLSSPLRGCGAPKYITSIPHPTHKKGPSNPERRRKFRPRCSNQTPEFRRFQLERCAKSHNFHTAPRTHLNLTFQS